MSKERKRGVILSYISILVSTILQLVYIPFLVKKMGTSEYGLYSLVASIIGYLAILDFGFGDALIQYTAQFHEKKQYEKEKKLQGMLLHVYMIIGFVAVIIGMIIFFNVNNIFSKSMTVAEIEKMKFLLLILIFNLGLTFPFSVYASIIKSYEQFTFQKVLAICHSILQPLIMIPLLLMGYKSICLTLVITFLNVMVMFSNYIYCRRKLKIRVKYTGMDNVLFKQIITFSFFIFLNIIVDKVNWSVDQTILGIYIGTTEVTIYSVAARINDVFILLSTSISGVLFPKISKMVARDSSDKQLSEEFIRTGRLQFYVIFLIITGFILFGKEFFISWVGKEYVKSYYITLLLIAPMIIPLTQNLGISILQAKNKHQFRSIVYTIIALLNIIISIPLAKAYGGVGAAFGTTICAFLSSGIVINIYYKKVGLDIGGFWKNIIRIAIPTVIPICIILLFMYLVPLHGFISVLVYGSIYTIIYIVICYFLSMNTFEKGIIKQLLRIK